jgi:hypothetical protein
MCYNAWVNASSGGKVSWRVGHGVLGWYSDVFSDRCELGYSSIRSNTPQCFAHTMSSEESRIRLTSQQKERKLAARACIVLPIGYIWQPPATHDAWGGRATSSGKTGRPPLPVAHGGGARSANVQHAAHRYSMCCSHCRLGRIQCATGSSDWRCVGSPSRGGSASPVARRIRARPIHVCGVWFIILLERGLTVSWGWHRTTLESGNERHIHIRLRQETQRHHSQLWRGNDAFPVHPWRD